MIDKNHIAFSPPKSNCTLWRYTDFTKLLSLLESRKLILARADQFDDPYEGAWTQASITALRDPNQNGGLPAEAVNQLLAGSSRMRQDMFISCWFASEHESAAMWKLYLQSPEGVAIRSDHDSLVAALARSSLRARTTKVNYIDYDQVQIPSGNLFFPYVHKRMSFAHENEVRAIVWSKEDVNEPQIQNDATTLAIDIIPEELIKAVHVSPTAPVWFGQLVEQILRRYGLACVVERSRLYDRPSY